jgi:hypothetical protein
VGVLLLLPLLVCLPAWGQRAAQLTGSVTDSTGAVIPEAKVTATNTATGVASVTTSNNAGIYIFVELVAGSYNVETSKPGFKTNSTAIVLEATRTTTLNMSLALGQTTQAVEVTAVAPTLETESPTVTNQVETKLIQDLPNQLRRPLQLLTTAAAVTYFMTEPTTTETPFFSVAGGKTMPALYIDGGNASNNRVEWNVLAINPTIEDAAEFRLVENSYKAEYGGSGGGLLLLTTKSGTNAFHGSVWEFHREKLFDARNFFAAQKEPFHENIYGVAAGGRIIKDKLFFFGTFEGTHNLEPQTTFETVPTAAERTGDFSQKFNLDGSLRTIYNPYSTTTVSGTVVRTPFQNNMIPASMLSPIALSVLSHVPAPNRPPDNITGINNFVGTATTAERRTGYTARIDYNHSEKDKFFYRLIWDNGPFQYDGPWPGDPLGAKIIAATGNLSTRNPWDPGDQVLLPWSRNQLGSWTHILRPTLINDVRFAFAARSWGAHSSSLSLGLPAMLGITLPPTPEATSGKFGTPLNAVPTFSTGYNIVGNSGWGAGDYQLPYRDWNLIESVTWVKSSHTIKAGYEIRYSGATSQGYGGWPGTFGFSQQGTSSGPFTTGTTGDGLASMLVDWPASWNASGFATIHAWTWWHAPYIQDDWRVNRNLTVNLGLRYELDTPVQEGMGSNCDLQAPYNWNHCKNRLQEFDPLPINPVSGTPGVFTFPQKAWNIDTTNFAPRLGFAYNLHGGTTVVRGGFGTFYYYPYEGWGARNFAGSRPDLAVVIQANSPNNGITAPFHMTSLPTFPPFDPSQINPGLYATPPGVPGRVGTTYMDPHYNKPYAIQWNFNIQHQLRNGLFFEVGYIGNNGRHLFGGVPLNQVPISEASASVTQLSRPFPQYTGITAMQTRYSSSYNALVAKVEKRYSNGLSFVSSYTWAKTLDNVGGPGGAPGFSIQDAYNLNAEKGLSNINHTNRFVFSGSYELPFGKGKRYLTSGPLAYVLGNWVLSPQFLATSGDPLTPYATPNLCNCFNSATRTNRVPGVTTVGPKTIQQWFNVDAFVDPASFTTGNTGRGVIIGPGMVNLDTSLSKDIRLTERFSLDLRVDAFNTLNHPNFHDPNVNIPQRNAEGQLLGTTANIVSAYDPRRLQLGAKFMF